MRKFHSRRSVKARQSSSPVLWLLVIDNEPIRKQILSGYYKAERAIAQARAEIEQFESGDIPAFQRWEAAAFGSLLTELRALSEAIESKNSLLDRIEHEMYYTGCDRLTAYRRLTRPPEPKPVRDDNPFGDPYGRAEEEADEEMRSEEIPKLFGDSDLPPGFDVEEFDSMSKREQAEVQEVYDDLAQLFFAETGIRVPCLDDALHGERERLGIPQPSSAKRPDKRQGKRPVAPEQKADRIKELYRKLVRQLHPDHKGSEQNQRERELWDQVQNAYRNRDLDSLEALLGRVEIGNSGNAASLPMQILKRMVKDLEGALRGIKRDLKKAQRHKAWKFSSRSLELPRMEAAFRAGFEAQLDLSRRQLQELERELGSLEAKVAKSRRNKKRSSRKNAPGSEEFTEGDQRDLFEWK